LNCGARNSYRRLRSEDEFTAEAWGDARIANQGFLDAVINRGIPIYLGNVPVAATEGYAWELQYLFTAGVPNGEFVPAW
jgi:hypothetical protein